MPQIIIPEKTSLYVISDDVWEYVATLRNRIIKLEKANDEMEDQLSQAECAIERLEPKPAHDKHVPGMEPAAPGSVGKRQCSICRGNRLARHTFGPCLNCSGRGTVPDHG